MLGPERFPIAQAQRTSACRMDNGQPTIEDESNKSCMKRQVYAASRCRTIDEMGNKGNVEVQALADGPEVDLYAFLVLIRMFFFISSANLPTG